VLKATFHDQVRAERIAPLWAQMSPTAFSILPRERNDVRTTSEGLVGATPCRPPARRPL